MNEIISIYKPSGITPLEAINHFRLNHRTYSDSKISYAGRLDPLADGVMLLLIDEANQQRLEYLNLDKQYKVDILIGIATDTYDPLGLITQSISSQFRPNKKQLKNLINNLSGAYNQPYPPYSSKHVNGKPLWWYAKQKLLETISIPSKLITIYNIKLLDIKSVQKEALSKSVQKSISQITGDFRQSEIMESWEKTLDNSSLDEYPLISLEVNCSSGTYMRQLAHRIGQKLHQPALAFNITRTRVGNYTLETCL